MNISYDSYRVFYYAAKYKSFSQAAALTTISRTSRASSAVLNPRCAARCSSASPQGVRLTPEGEKLYAHIVVAFESIEAGEAEILSDQSLQSGVVHIAASGLRCAALSAAGACAVPQRVSARPHLSDQSYNAAGPCRRTRTVSADFAVVSEGSRCSGFSRDAEGRRNTGDPPHLRFRLLRTGAGDRDARSPCGLSPSSVSPREHRPTISIPTSFCGTTAAQSRRGGRDHRSSPSCCALQPRHWVCPARNARGGAGAHRRLSAHAGRADRTAQHLSVPAKKSAVEHRCQAPAANAVG